MKWTTKLCKASEIENGKTRESFVKTRFLASFPLLCCQITLLMEVFFTKVSRIVSDSQIQEVCPAYHAHL